MRFVAGSMSVPTPEGVERVVPVESTQDLLEAVLAEAADADVLVMAAAVADFRPAEVSDAKMKKGEKAERLEALFRGDGDLRSALAVTEEQAAKIAAWLPEGMK